MQGDGIWGSFETGSKEISGLVEFFSFLRRQLETNISQFSNEFPLNGIGIDNHSLGVSVTLFNRFQEYSFRETLASRQVNCENTIMDLHDLLANRAQIEEEHKDSIKYSLDMLRIVETDCQYFHQLESEERLREAEEKQRKLAEAVEAFRTVVYKAHETLQKVERDRIDTVNQILSEYMDAEHTVLAAQTGMLMSLNHAIQTDANNNTKSDIAHSSNSSHRGSSDVVNMFAPYNLSSGIMALLEASQSTGTGTATAGTQPDQWHQPFAAFDPDSSVFRKIQEGQSPPREKSPVVLTTPNRKAYPRHDSADDMSDLDLNNVAHITEGQSPSYDLRNLPIHLQQTANSPDIMGFVTHALSKPLLANGSYADDFLMTAEKASPNHHRAGPNDRDRVGEANWSFGLEQKGLNLDSAFSLTDIRSSASAVATDGLGRAGEYSILDTASSYSDIQIVGSDVARTSRDFSLTGISSSSISNARGGESLNDYHHTATSTQPYHRADGAYHPSAFGSTNASTSSSLRTSWEAPSTASALGLIPPPMSLYEPTQRVRPQSFQQLDGPFPSQQQQHPTAPYAHSQMSEPFAPSRSLQGTLLLPTYDSAFDDNRLPLHEGGVRTSGGLVSASQRYSRLSGSQDQPLRPSQDQMRRSQSQQQPLNQRYSQQDYEGNSSSSSGIAGKSSTSTGPMGQNGNVSSSRDYGQGLRQSVNSSKNLRSSKEFKPAAVPALATVPPGNTSNSSSIRPPELVETPRSKSAYKEFSRVFKIKEKESYTGAMTFAADTVKTIGDCVKWRVYMEMADLAKRNYITKQARECFALACQSQPRATLAFLEWSKMEEESGCIHRALNILIFGLKITPCHEALFTRTIRLQERLHNFDEVQALLGTLHKESLDNSWKSLFEGALFEARIGNLNKARTLLDFLMVQVPWYGPIYYEAVRLEEKEQNETAAMEIIRRGLKELSRYGPLWFSRLRIMERRDKESEGREWMQGSRPEMHRMRQEASVAVKHISRELTWKVYFELAMAEERAAEIAALGMSRTQNTPLAVCRNLMMRDVRSSMTKSLLLCPDNLRWKVLLAGARLELGVGQVDTARQLLQRAFAEVPPKSRASVYLECVRLEEYTGGIDTARRLIARAKNEVRSEWKVFLESALLEARAGDLVSAASEARAAVEVHPGTGRLWALYIQLHHRLESRGAQQQHQADIAGTKDEVIYRALTEVAKSGEVWCERGRCLMNPLHKQSFDLSDAQRCFSFAMQFTPQYGDTFIECARLEMLCQVLLPQVLGLLRVPLVPFVEKYLVEDLDSDTVDTLMTTSTDYNSTDHGEQIKDDYWALKQSKAGPPMPVPGSYFDRNARRLAMTAIQRLEYGFKNTVDDYTSIALKRLHRRCANADPNYGSAWFECRSDPNDVPFTVLTSAVHAMAVEMVRTEQVYARAILHFVCKCIGSECKMDLQQALIVQRDSANNSISAFTSPVKQQPAAVQRSGATQFSTPVRDGREAELQAALRKRKDSESQCDAAEDPVVSDGRYTELCTDIDLVRSLMSSGASPTWTEPFRTTVSVKDGAVYAYEDFVTGLVHMNRNAFGTNLTADTRRKNIYAADSIIA